MIRAKSNRATPVERIDRGGMMTPYIDVAIPAIAGFLALARPEVFLRAWPDMRRLRVVRLFGVLLLIVAALYLAVRLMGL